MAGRAGRSIDAPRRLRRQGDGQPAASLPTGGELVYDAGPQWAPGMQLKRTDTFGVPQALGGHAGIEALSESFVRELVADVPGE